MDVTFRESEPYYGEKTDLSSRFDLGSYSCLCEDYQDGENGRNVVEEKEHNQSRRMEIIIRSIPCPASNLYGNDMQNSMDIKKYTCKARGKVFAGLY